MANRTVSVALKMLIGEYVPEAEKAATATDKIGQSAQKTAATHKAGMKTIVAGAGIAAAAGAAGLAAMVGAAANFDKAMSGVAAVSNASAGELHALRDAALKAGADTAFSASHAADAEGELAKAGVSTSDILGGALTGSLSLAAAGQLDLADAATISAQAMNIWKLKGSDVAHIADVLAAGANKSAADVGQLGDAMRQGGLVASQMGIGFEDTIGALSAFADRALIGSDAGTSLKTMLQALAAPSGEAADMMKKLGINAYNAQGQFVGLDKFAGQLHTRLGKLSEQERNTALTTIFGSDAVRAANVLYSIGAAGVDEYTKAVNDQGTAQRNAATQMDNLSGDLEQLRGSLETALIKGGSEATGALRTMTQQATSAVNAFGDLPGPLQAAVIALVAVGTAGTGALATIGTVAPKIKEARSSLQELGAAGRAANTALGVIGKGFAISLPVIGLASAAIEIFAHRKAEATKRVEDFTQAIIADNGAIGSNTRQVAANTLEQSGALKAAQSLGLSLKDVTDAVLGSTTAQARLNAELAPYLATQPKITSYGKASTVSYDQQHAAAKTLSDTINGLNKEVSSGVAAAQRKAAAEGQAKTSSDALATATTGVTGALQEEKSVADQVKDAIDRLNGANLGAAQTDISYRNAVAAVTQSIKDNGRTLDLNTQKGRDNRSAILAAIQAAEVHAQAVATQTNSVDKGTAVFARHIAALRRTLLASGLTKAEVDRLIATYGRVPHLVVTNVDVNDNASAKLQNIIRLRNEAGRAVEIRIGTGPLAKEGKAAGGWLTGGIPNVDSIPLANGDLGMPGEFVVKKSAAQANGPLLEAINAGRLVTVAARAGGTQVTVAAGAMPIYVQGNLDRSVLPDVQRMVDAKFRQLAGQIATGRRG